MESEVDSSPKKKRRIIPFKHTQYRKNWIRHTVEIDPEDIRTMEFNDDVDNNEMWNEQEPLSPSEYELALNLNELKMMYIKAERESIHYCAEKYRAYNQDIVNAFKLRCLELISIYREEFIFEILKPLGFNPVTYFGVDAIPTDGIHTKMKTKR